MSNIVFSMLDIVFFTMDLASVFDWGLFAIKRSELNFEDLVLDLFIAYDLYELF